MRSGTIQIEQFDPKSDPERLRACHVIAMSAWDIDNPGVPPLTFETYAAQLQTFDGSPVHTFLATDPAGRPVGYCRITLPAKENLSMAFCALTVALDQRRTGRARPCCRSALRSPGPPAGPGWRQAPPTAPPARPSPWPWGRPAGTLTSSGR